MAGLVWLAPALAAAQQLPSPAQPVPPSREQISPPPSIRERAEPGLTVQPGIGGTVPPGARQIEVTLNAILVDGMTAYQQEQFSVLWNEQLGTKVALARVFEIAAEIERQYRADGYFLSRVYVPEQTVSDGRFKISVVEGYVSDVVVQGEVGDVRKLIQRYVNQIVGRRPISSADIERYLLLANDIPGITAKGTLQPADKDGASQLVVDATLEGLDGFATVNNRSSRFTGPWVGAVAGAINSQSELGERTEVVLLNTLFSREQTYVQGSLETRFGSEGFKLKGTLSYGPSHPGSTLKPLDVDAVSTGVEIEASYPVLRSRRLDWRTSLAFDLDNIETDASGAAFSTDRLRVLRLVNSFRYRDPFAGVNSLSLGLHKGLHIMSATDTRSLPQSRAEGETSFWKGTIEASRLQGIWSGEDTSVNLLVSAAAQYTKDKLLAAEEFRLGGEKFGRGYDPGELLGDRGIAGSAELQVNLTTGNTDWFTAYQLYTFVDAGNIYNLDTGARRWQGLVSGGVGVRFQVTEKASAEVELAQPLTRNPTADGTDRPPMVYFRLSTLF